MRRIVDVPGIAGRIEVDAPGIFTGSKLFVNGLPAPPGPKRGQFLLNGLDGSPQVAYFKGGFPDPMPLLIVGQLRIRLAEPLTWYEWIWAGFPLVLILVGGAIGGGLGALAATVNAQVFHSNAPLPARYLFSAAITASTILIWLTLVAAISLRMGR